MHVGTQPERRHRYQPHAKEGAASEWTRPWQHAEMQGDGADMHEICARQFSSLLVMVHALRPLATCMAPCCCVLPGAGVAALTRQLWSAARLPAPDNSDSAAHASYTKQQDAASGSPSQCSWSLTSLTAAEAQGHHTELLLMQQSGASTEQWCTQGPATCTMAVTTAAAACVTGPPSSSGSSMATTTCIWEPLSIHQCWST